MISNFISSSEIPRIRRMNDKSKQNEDIGPWKCAGKQILLLSNLVWR
jgi:hypothetical protein